jgi:hypothetical protein
LEEVNIYAQPSTHLDQMPQTLRISSHDEHLVSDTIVSASEALPPFLDMTLLKSTSIPNPAKKGSFGKLPFGMFP